MIIVINQIIFSPQNNIIDSSKICKLFLPYVKLYSFTKSMDKFISLYLFKFPVKEVEGAGGALTLSFSTFQFKAGTIRGHDIANKFVRRGVYL